MQSLRKYLTEIGIMFTLGAFAVILDDDGNVLLSHRQDFDVWNLPGGSVEHGELPYETVVREVKEETGLDVLIERLTGIYGKADKDELVFTFRCRITHGHVIATDEADQSHFFPIHALPETTLGFHNERIEDALNTIVEPVFRRQVTKTQ
jgi:8-oxo-dGTP diphosphatase